MCINISLDCSTSYIKKAQYTFEVLFDTLGFPYTFVDSNERNKIMGGILISYGGADDSKGLSQDKIGRILISESWTEDIDQIQVGFLSTPEGEKLPVLSKKGDKVSQRISAPTDDLVLIQMDLIFSSFFFLSRWEEMVSKTTDRHGRFITRESISHAYQFSQRAILNEYLKFLLEIISQIARAKKIPLLRKCFWPNGQKLAVCLTHDVDIIEKWYIYSLIRCLELIKTGQLSSFLTTFWSLIKGIMSAKNPALAFEQITSAEDKFFFRSSFYFMMGKPKLKDLFSSDITYDLSKPNTLEKAREVLKEGFEIGLHASYNTFLDPQSLLKEKEELERLIDSPILGLRQHFLRFKIPESWIDQNNCGFLYDTTLGFADRSGYRASFTFPFNTYDLKNDQKMSLIELPLVIMDRTYSKYLSFSPDEIMEDVINIFRDLEDSGGLATILWHTHMVDELGFSGYPQLYEKILDFMYRKGYFVASAKEIADWWRRRTNFELKNHFTENKKTSWEFVGFDPMDKISFELIAVSAENLRVEGCDYQVTREGQNTLAKLEGIEKGRKVTIAIEIT